MKDFKNGDKAYSQDSESFDRFSLSDLINDNDMQAGDIYFVGEISLCDPTEIVTAEGIIERLSEVTYDVYGEFAEDYPEVSDEAEAELNELLKNWINKLPKPRFFTVTNVEEYTITDDDFKNAEAFLGK